MITYLKLQQNKTIGEIQEDFNQAFPFLKIEFYKKAKSKTETKMYGHLQKSMTLEKAGITGEGTLRITDAMTVGELENIFKERFGLYVQVSRKSGSLWLETTMTDKWTLRQQNDHGKELSKPAEKIGDDNEIDYA